MARNAMAVHPNPPRAAGGVESPPELTSAVFMWSREGVDEAQRQWLGPAQAPDERLPIAVNADSLATWVLPALDAVVRDGQREGWGLELVVDDQDFTHDRLREGTVLGCVSTVVQALRGCTWSCQ